MVSLGQARASDSPPDWHGICQGWFSQGGIFSVFVNSTTPPAKPVVSKCALSSILVLKCLEPHYQIPTLDQNVFHTSKETHIPAVSNSQHQILISVTSNHVSMCRT